MLQPCGVNLFRKKPIRSNICFVLLWRTKTPFTTNQHLAYFTRLLPSFANTTHQNNLKSRSLSCCMVRPYYNYSLEYCTPDSNAKEKAAGWHSRVMKQEAEAARKILHSIYHFHWWNIKFSNPGILFNMQALEDGIIALGCLRLPTLVLLYCVQY